MLFSRTVVTVSGPDSPAAPRRVSRRLAAFLSISLGLALVFGVGFIRAPGGWGSSPGRVITSY